MTTVRLLALPALLAACGGGTVREVPPNDPPQQQGQVEPQQQQQVQQQPVCPQGSTWNGSACVGTVDTSCPAGTAFVENRGCVAVRGGGQVSSPPPPPPPPGQTCPPGTGWSGTQCLVTKAAWVQQMNQLLPGKICALPIFQKCFRATRPECERIVAGLSDACMGDRNLPPLFDNARGEREGEAVGRCIGEAYVQNMKARNRAVSSPDCQ